MKLNFQMLNKHTYDGRKCVGFDIEVSGKKFWIMKNQNDNNWRMHSYGESNIPVIEFDIPQGIETLVGIAKVALTNLMLCSRDQINMYAVLIDGVNELIGGHENEQQ